MYYFTAQTFTVVLMSRPEYQPSRMSDPLRILVWHLPQAIVCIYVYDYLPNVIPFLSSLDDSLMAQNVHLVYHVAPRPNPAQDSDKDPLMK